MRKQIPPARRGSKRRNWVKCPRHFQLLEIGISHPQFTFSYTSVQMFLLLLGKNKVRINGIYPAFEMC